MTKKQKQALISLLIGVPALGCMWIIWTNTNPMMAGGALIVVGLIAFALLRAMTKNL